MVHGKFVWYDLIIFSQNSKIIAEPINRDLIVSPLWSGFNSIKNQQFFNKSFWKNKKY